MASPSEIIRFRIPIQLSMAIDAEVARLRHALPGVSTSRSEISRRALYAYFERPIDDAEVEI